MTLPGPPCWLASETSAIYSIADTTTGSLVGYPLTPCVTRTCLAVATFIFNGQFGFSRPCSDARSNGVGSLSSKASGKLPTSHDIIIIPSSNGYCHIPASVLEKPFELYDLQQAQAQATEINRSVADKIRGLNSTNVFWQRMRSICPKTIFYPGPIEKSDGSICKTGEDMDEAMLETRQFWFEDPVADDSQWDHILQCYADAMTFWPEVPLPTDSDYTAAVLSSKDSAPGPDGLPYAAWRLDVTQSSEAMVHFMVRIQSQCAVPPVRVGVWIPKAKLGTYCEPFPALRHAIYL